MYLGDMYIGQGSQRSPNKILGADLGPPRIWRRLVFHDRWAALCFAYGRIDHRAKHALPANVKDKSNDSI